MPCVCRITPTTHSNNERIARWCGFVFVQLLKQIPVAIQLQLPLLACIAPARACRRFGAFAMLKSSCNLQFRSFPTAFPFITNHLRDVAHMSRLLLSLFQFHPACRVQRIALAHISDVAMSKKRSKSKNISHKRSFRTRGQFSLGF